MSSLNIKLIIFDLDGTLVNAYPAIISSFNYTMQKLKLPKQRALIIRRAVGWGDENLLKPFVKKEDLKTAVLVYRKHHKYALLEGSYVFSNVNKLLTYLKNKGFKLAVASNRPTAFSKILIRHLKLSRYFDFVLCADKLKHIKPHPEILNTIMQHFSLKSEQSLYVGDMVIDAIAGRRAKIRTVIVTTGSNTKQEVKKGKPYIVINRIFDLLQVL
jgi:phosphoglycolate phosphatase